jgi:hypothetical protein
MYRYTRYCGNSESSSPKYYNGLAVAKIFRQFRSRHFKIRTAGLKLGRVFSTDASFFVLTGSTYSPRLQAHSL